MQGPVERLQSGHRASEKAGANKRPRTAGHCVVYFAFHPIAAVGGGGDFLRNPETLGLIDPIDPPRGGNEKRVASRRPVWHVICSRTSQLSLVARGHGAPAL